MIAVAASHSVVDPLTLWLPGLMAVFGALGGSAVTGWLAYLRENRLRRDDRDHARMLREQDRATEVADASAARIRGAYLDLLSAIHEGSRLHAEFVEEMRFSDRSHGLFAYSGLDTALGTLQLAVPEEEGSDVEAIVREFRVSHMEAVSEAHASIVRSYRKYHAS